MSDNYKTNIPQSLEIERRVLAGLLIYAEKIWPEIEGIISVKNFYQEHKHNSIIFTIIKGFCDEGKTLEPALIAEKIKNLGIRFDEIEPLDYIESLKQIEITELGLKEAIKELLKISVRRALYLSCRKQAQFINKEGANLECDELIAKVHETHAEVIKEYGSLKNEPKNVFDNIENIVIEYGKNKKELPGLIGPWPKWNSFYGGFLLRESYGICARPEFGKSTVLDDLCLSMGNLINQEKIINSEHIPVIKLDSEMSEETVRLRLLTRLSGVPIYYIQTGKYTQNKELYDKVMNAVKIMRNYKYYHLYCPSMSVIEQKNIVKRWIFKHVGIGNPFIINYDYIKIGAEKLTESNKETNIFGYKLNIFNDFIKENGGLLLFGAQANREGIVRNGKINDDSGIVFGSDKLQQFASYLAILRRRSMEELAKFPQGKFGTHKFQTIKAGRMGGERCKGHADVVKICGKYEPNFFNLNIDGFKVEERGDAEDIKRWLEGTVLLDKHDNNQEDDIGV